LKWKSFFYIARGGNHGLYKKRLQRKAGMALVENAQTIRYWKKVYKNLKKD